MDKDTIRTHNGERIDSSINGVGETRQPHEEEWYWTFTTQHIQKSTQNGLNT